MSFTQGITVGTNGLAATKKHPYAWIRLPFEYGALWIAHSYVTLSILAPNRRFEQIWGVLEPSDGV